MIFRWSLCLCPAQHDKTDDEEYGTDPAHLLTRIDGPCRGTHEHRRQQIEVGPRLPGHTAQEGGPGRRAPPTTTRARRRGRARRIHGLCSSTRCGMGGVPSTTRLRYRPPGSPEQPLPDQPSRDRYHTYNKSRCSQHPLLISPEHARGQAHRRRVQKMIVRHVVCRQQRRIRHGSVTKPGVGFVVGDLAIKPGRRTTMATIVAPRTQL